MDAKKALIETQGDVAKAVEWLRKKGLSSADKKSGRVASEGVIASYIHAGSRWVHLLPWHGLSYSAPIPYRSIGGRAPGGATLAWHLQSPAPVCHQH